MTKKIRYSDGMRPEKDMLTALESAKDVSLESEELMKKIKDLPSYYHFGVGRSVIMRCLDLPKKSRILELGAGCGAITRTLGETFESVEAFEESPIRAKIARERCRDLNNVSIFCENIRNVRFSPDYDIAVVIGVLEYAAVYIYPEKGSKEACLSFLELVKSSLSADGCLVLAIENRIGLDYWAGAPENHTGRPYDGIHEYPNPGSQITFTRRELQNLLANAGFSHTEFYFCFPDYHFPRTIFSSIGNEREYYLHNWVEFHHGSPSNPKKPNFNKSLAAKALSDSGLLREFANAFLVVASGREKQAPDWIAKTYNMRRRESFRNVTTLHLNPKPFVQKTALPSIPGGTPASLPTKLIHRAGSAVWHPGTLVTFEIERASLGRNFPEYVKKLLDRYNREIMNNFNTGKTDEEGFPLLRSSSLDLVFENIIQSEAGGWQFIDEEIHTKSSIPIDFVIYRCIRFSLYRHGITNHQSRKIIRSLYPSYTRNRHRQNCDLTDSLQEEMVLELINPKLFQKNLIGRILRNDRIRFSVEKIWFKFPRGVRSFIRNRI